MQEKLKDFISKRVKNPKKQEAQDILSLFQTRKYRRGDVFKERDTKIKELGFLIEGSARTMIVNRKGDEITGQITQEYNFLADLISLRTKESTPIIIEFIEDSTVLVAKIPDVLSELETNLTFNILMREYIADKTVEMGKRHISFLTGTAKERYQFVLESNPHLLKKFPLRFIATMIGITPTQLSRIRNEKI